MIEKKTRLGDVTLDEIYSFCVQDVNRNCSKDCPFYVHDTNSCIVSERVIYGAGFKRDSKYLDTKIEFCLKGMEMNKEEGCEYCKYGTPLLYATEQYPQEIKINYTEKAGGFLSFSDFEDVKTRKLKKSSTYLGIDYCPKCGRKF